MPDSPWPPPSVPAAPPTGWYLASDGNWYQSAIPPAPGYVLATDGRWYSPTDVAEPWRTSEWGLGDLAWALLVYLVVGTGAALAIGAIVVTRDGDMSLDDVEFGPYSIGALVLTNAVALAGVPWLATKRKGLASLADDFGLRMRWVDLAIGFGFGLGGLIAAGLVGTAIDAALGADEATSNLPVDDLANAGQFIVFIVAVGIVTPFIEELFFRGLVYRSFLKRGSRPVIAMALTTLVFVLPHLTAVTEWPGVLSLFASIAVLGATFNLACHLTENRLAAPIVAHMVINCTASIALLFT